jgi:hypothetical protein
MKYIPTILLSIATSTGLSAEVLYGLFHYTSNGVSNGSIIWAPEHVSEPAFITFDTDSQTLKIFNFMEEYISSDSFSHDFHRYSVVRHVGTDPIESLQELTDLSLVQWIHYEETVLQPGDIPWYVQISTQPDGRFNYSEPAFLGAGARGTGEITSFILSTREEGNLESWSVETETTRVLFILDTKVGYKYKIFEGTSLTSLSPRSLATWRNQSGDGMLIGSGEDWFAVATSGRDQFFMTAISYPLETTD